MKETADDSKHGRAHDCESDSNPNQGKTTVGFFQSPDSIGISNEKQRRWAGLW